MKYRELEPGEVIQEGDEYLGPDGETWVEVPPDGFGENYQPRRSEGWYHEWHRRPVGGTGLPVLFDLKTAISGVYKTAECEDVPVESPTVTLTCLIGTGEQRCDCVDGSSWVRKTDFANDWGQWVRKGKPAEQKAEREPAGWVPEIGSVVGFPSGTGVLRLPADSKGTVVVEADGEYRRVYWGVLTRVDTPEQKAERELDELSSEIYEMLLQECQATDEVIDHKMLARFFAKWLIEQGEE